MHDALTKRDLTIDYLKFLALLGLLIAHISENKLLLQIRSFDVNLLVILSAMLASRNTTHAKSSDSLFDWNYILKRFRRLIVPTWIFISIYLALNFVFKFQELTTVQIIRSYLLQDNSISYVWIVYVYFLCAILMPVVMLFDLNKLRDALIFCVISLVYILLYNLSGNYYYRVVILYPIVYALISVIGVNWNTLEKRKKVMFVLFNLIFFAVYAIYLMNINDGVFQNVDLYKYPPKLYYLSYTLLASVLCIEAFKKIHMPQNCILTRYVVFISKSSLWFYLWHILSLQISYRMTENLCVRYFIVLILTSVIVWLQSCVVRSLEKQGINPRLLKILKG